MRRETWYDELHTFYMMECGGHGFGGVIRPRIVDIAPRPRVSPGVTPPPHVPNYMELPDDPYMEGVCIYPGNYEQMVDGMFRGIDTKMGWDERLRNYFRRDWHNTDLIAHHWRAVNYREEDGQLLCDDGPDNQFGTKHGGVVKERACLIHGCKDDSLAKLILKWHGAEMIDLDQFSHKAPASVIPMSAPEAKAKTVPTNPQKAQFTPLTPTVPSQQTTGSDSAMAAELERIKAQRELAQQNLQQTTINKIPELAQLKEMVQASTKAIRGGDLAKRLGVQEAALKSVLTPESGIKIGQGGYLKIAA
jgi:hypothetical protein